MIKKRYIVVASVILLIFIGIYPLTKPVLPTIQLPGEVYVGTEGWLPDFLFNGAGITNTFVAFVLSCLIVLLIGFVVRPGSMTADETPTGFYNFFEMLIEGAYSFAERVAGPKIKDFFPYFMTFLLLILVANWMELVPLVDSFGMWENKAHFEALKDMEEIEADLAAADNEEAKTAFISGLEELYHVEIHLEDGHLSHESEEELLHEIEHMYDEENIGDLREGVFLLKAQPDEHGEKPEDADWTIVPFLRAAATDLNFTLALAIIAMVMVQYYGFKYQGAGYLIKFFPFAAKDFGPQVSKNPIKAIDPVVGILELVSEFAKIISFAFRLLGNIFAGQVLLFVMASLVPLANIAFFGLELFVGLIQAAIFALLTLNFMNSATESHHDHAEEHAY